MKHEFDLPSTGDIFTWTVTYLDAEVRRDPVARARLLSMTSVAGGGDDHVLVPYNGPATLPPTALNFEGLWWNAPAGSEAGWGINFAHQGDVIFATWFTHDANGNAWYLSMTAAQTGPNTFAGTLYRTTGPPLDAIAFDPSQVQRIAVGSGTLSFADGNNGTFAYTVNGISQSKAITRQVFGSLPTCTWGALTDLTLATNYQDLWWAALAGVESGWGINLTHQGDVIFATWFSYDFTGAALPLSATLTKTGSRTYSGTLIRTSGPPFSAVPFDPAAVTRTSYGTATLTFTNGNARHLFLPGERRHAVHDADKVHRAPSVPPTGNGLPVGGLGNCLCAGIGVSMPTTLVQHRRRPRGTSPPILASSATSGRTTRRCEWPSRPSARRWTSRSPGAETVLPPGLVALTSADGRRIPDQNSRGRRTS